MISWILNLWNPKLVVLYQLHPLPCLITRKADIWSLVIAKIITIITIITITITTIITIIIDW